MAKKTHSKRFTSRVHRIVESDFFTSLAIFSILLNIFLIVGVFVLTNSDTYNRSVYEAVQSRYCKNIDGIVERAAELGDKEQALAEWRVSCVSKEFAPYYNEAVEKFEASSRN